jgi:predicted metal-dependent enzyme (double-stranded beta helix superfamily)
VERFLTSIKSNIVNRFSREERKVINAYQDVFDLESPQVKTVLADMFRRGHVLGTTYTGPNAVNDMILQEGERNFVLQIIAFLQLSADEVIDITQESDEPMELEA